MNSTNAHSMTGSTGFIPGKSRSAVTPAGFFPLCLTFILSVLVSAVMQCRASDIFWTDSAASVKKCKLNGSAIHSVAAAGLGAAWDVVVNDSTGKIYWSTAVSPASQIWEANKDGSARRLVATFVGLAQLPLAINPAGGTKGHLYWYEVSGLRMTRLDIGLGTTVSVPVSTALNIRAMAVDPRPGSPNLYYYDGKTIYRAALDGSSVAALPNTVGDGDPGSIAIDTCNDRIFVLGISIPRPSPSFPFIKSVRLSDAGDQKTVFSGASSVGGSYEGDIAFDMHKQRIYWTTLNYWSSTPEIRSANTDGTGLTTVVAGTTPDIFQGIALCLTNKKCPTTKGSKTLVNTTVGAACGVEWIIRGRHTVLSHFDGPSGEVAPVNFPNFTVTATEERTVLRWSGAAVAPGATVQVGFEVPGGSIRTMGVSWLQNTGSFLDYCVQASLDEDAEEADGEIQFHNDARLWISNQLYIGELTVDWSVTEASLGSLHPGANLGSLRRDQIPGGPIAIAPGGSAKVQIPLPPAGARHAIVHYTVSTDPSLTGPQVTKDLQEITLQPQDSDLDGLPDFWERQHGFDPSSSTDASEDHDHDGADNLSEYEAITDPLSGAGSFGIKSVVGGDGLHVQFDARAGRTYELEGSSDLNGWELLRPPHFSAADAAVDWIVPTSGPRFFRVKVAADQLVTGAPVYVQKVALEASGETWVAPVIVNPDEFRLPPTAASGMTISFAGASLAPGALAGGSYYIEASSGPGAGRWSNITGNTATTVTTSVSLAAFINSQTLLCVRRHLTIGQLFGQENQAGLNPGEDPITADEIRIWDAESQSDRIVFYSPAGWTDGDFNQAGETVVRPDQVVRVFRKTPDPLTLTFSGMPRRTPLRINIQPGLNYVPSPGLILPSAPWLAATTLAQSGFTLSLEEAVDVLSTWNGNPRALKSYYLDSSQWFETVGGAAGTVALTPGEGVRIEGVKHKSWVEMMQNWN